MQKCAYQPQRQKIIPKWNCPKIYRKYSVIFVLYLLDYAVVIEPATFVSPKLDLVVKCRNVMHSNRLDLAAQLVEHTTKLKFVGSISTPVKQFFSFPGVNIYFFTQVTYNLSGYLHTLYTQHANFDHMFSFFC